MKCRLAAYAVLVLLCGCAAKELTREVPPIVAVRATFPSHLSLVRTCESRGVAPTLEAAKAAGANLALVFAHPTFAAPGMTNPQHPGDKATWVPFELKEADLAGYVIGVRAFKCPDAFIDNVTAGMKQSREVPK